MTEKNNLNLNFGVRAFLSGLLSFSNSLFLIVFLFLFLFDLVVISNLSTIPCPTAAFYIVLGFTILFFISGFIKAFMLGGITGPPQVSMVDEKRQMAFTMVNVLNYQAVIQDLTKQLPPPYGVVVGTVKDNQIRELTDEEKKTWAATNEKDIIEQIKSDIQKDLEVVEVPRVPGTRT